MRSATQLARGRANDGVVPWRPAIVGVLAVALAMPVTAQTPVTPAPAQKPPAVAAAAPAAPPESAKFSQQELDQLLAPVALYPDALLAQVLMASTYPLDIVSAERWVKANPGLKDQALQDALQQQPWDPSVKSLAVFPQVLTMMSERLDWTQRLGDAFLAQQKEVLATAQSLRAKAQAQGNLKDSPEQKVVTQQEGATTYITIEPTNPEVVYVPTYNPTVVYGSWWWPAYPPYYWYPPGYVAGGALLGFTAGVIVGGALWGNTIWGGGNVNIDIDRYNNFNRTNISNRDWQHNAERRGAVPYRDSATAQQYGKGRAADATSREAFQGRAEAGRQSIQRGEVGTSDLGSAFRGDAGGGAAAARDAGRGAAGSRDYGAGAGSRDFGASASTRDYSGTRGGNAFDSGYSGAQARDYGSRGASSMSASRGAGNMSAGRAGGGGARMGGGGGRGGRR